MPSTDWDNQQVSCPQGHRNAWWHPASQRGTDVIVVKFAGQVCQPCPAKAQCTIGRQGAKRLRHKLGRKLGRWQRAHYRHTRIDHGIAGSAVAYGTRGFYERARHHDW